MPTATAILDAALHALTEKGSSAATIDDVRERSGASVGSIYHHFGGNEQLAAALLRTGAGGAGVREDRPHPRWARAGC